MTERIRILLETLDLTDTGARTSEDIFTGTSHPMPLDRVFGGQVMAQAVVAAQRTVQDDRRIHSVHGYFVRPGDVALPITFSVERIHDGRSFSTRRVQAYQNALPIMSMISSFQDEDEGPSSQHPMPEGLPAPEELPSSDDVLAPFAEHPSARAVIARPFDIRHVEGPVYVPDPNRPRHGKQHVWIKAKDRLPDDDALHRAALAYLSDYAILEPIVRMHGAAWSTPGLKAASLDHAVWWHRPVRVDEWLLLELETSSSGGGRGLGHGHVYRADGTHVATIAQEGMVRVPVEGPGA
ncbi:acyl-CoA thioesterase II [Agrococcus sp. HG114]|uniref:acyl-CoA thioesterase n=1 Tax=Agrococcus sp. HG114 TaxID=2969757 RepID=UPI00215AED19|nr:acyl-CoA thioesterase II [Agrococcus sp. HG114]MCR8671699.1 acyl-CoA thioesterase II [Agrococcus sp. HG114]